MSKKIITALFATLVVALGITACQPKDSTTTTTETGTTTEADGTTQDETSTTTE